jgi:hypothetical protein
LGKKQKQSPPDQDSWSLREDKTISTTRSRLADHHEVGQPVAADVAHQPDARAAPLQPGAESSSDDACLKLGRRIQVMHHRGHQCKPAVVGSTAAKKEEALRMSSSANQAS